MYIDDSAEILPLRNIGDDGHPVKDEPCRIIGAHADQFIGSLKLRCTIRELTLLQYLQHYILELIGEEQVDQIDEFDNDLGINITLSIDDILDDLPELVHALLGTLGSCGFESDKTFP